MSAIRAPAPRIAALLIDATVTCGDMRSLEIGSIPTNSTPLLLATMMGCVDAGVYARVHVCAYA
jgi:hypothetical protein